MWDFNSAKMYVSFPMLTVILAEYMNHAYMNYLHMRYSSVVDPYMNLRVINKNNEPNLDLVVSHSHPRADHMPCYPLDET